MLDLDIDFKKMINKVNKVTTMYSEGIVKKVIGLTVEVQGIKAFVGELCIIYNESNVPINCEVVGFREEFVILMPLDELIGISPGCKVVPQHKPLSVKCSEALLGHIIDGLGRPLDVDDDFEYDGVEYPLENDAPDPMKRQRIKDIMPTGVRAIDGFITLGDGQRIGIFAGSGVGKSTTLGMIAREAKADINVISLIGERGREVREFMEKDLGPEGAKRSIVVCATSDRPALIRMKGALTATALAEYFRDQGKKVILMMDSVTRYAMAQREVGLAIGEPPATKGYTPSVFAKLPKLMERAGAAEKGTITAIYTVLVDGDDFNEPIADAVRGILDGHIVLSRALAHKNHYPAIDVLNSVSRLMSQIASKEHKEAASEARDLLSVYKDSEDLINLGAYVKGSSPKIDRAIEYHDKIEAFLKQNVDESTPFEETQQRLETMFN